MLRVFLAILALFFLAGGIIAVVDALDRAGRSFVRAVLALCIAGFAVAAGVLVSLSVELVAGTSSMLGLEARHWAGIATTCLLLGLAAWRHARDDEPLPALTSEDLRLLEEPLPHVPVTAPAGPWWSAAGRRARKLAREDRDRLQAWDLVARRADWAAARIAVARKSCEGFLACLTGEPSHHAAELAVALRRRVPEIISDAMDGCRGATPSEARAVMDEAVELLELLAAEAERRRVQPGGTSSRLATKRAYVEEVIRRGRSA